MATVNPYAREAASPELAAVPVAVPPPQAKAEAARTAPAKPRPQAPRRPEPGVTLDAGWDRRLAAGAVQPDSMIDLHGHDLASAYAVLDSGLERALARGDRILLLVTGKPPRPESERPHARGRIRAAVGDWLAASRHAGRIAAIRGAHPRHGGAGALYIVLRRARQNRG